LNSVELDNLYFVVLGKVLNYLSYGLKTEREITQKLDVYIKKLYVCDSDKLKIRDHIILRLKELNLFDDKKVLSDLILKANSASKPKNKKKLSISLLKRGLKSDDINTLLNTLDPDHEYTCALTDYKKKARFATDLVKIKKYLLNKGYSFDTVTKVLEDSFLTH